MLRKFQRPLSAEEKRILENAVRTLQEQMRSLAKRLLTVCIVLCGILWGLTMLASDVSWQVISLFWLAICVGISTWVLLSERRKHQKRIRSLNNAQERNVAEVVQIQSVKMVEFDEIHDEGACYAFQIEDDKIVFVVGQEFYRSSKFPNTDFELVHIYDSAQNLVEMVVIKRGARLKPARTIAAEQKARLNLPEHLETCAGNLDKLENLLGSIKTR